MESLLKIVVAALSIFFLTVPFVTTTPDMTIVYENGNGNTYAAGGYANSVDYVLEDMVTVTPNHPGYDYHTKSPYTTEVAYGHSMCNTTLTFSDCGTCVSAAKSNIKQLYPNSLGVQMDLKDCSMRYENYYI